MIQIQSPCQCVATGSITISAVPLEHAWRPGTFPSGQLKREARKDLPENLGAPEAVNPISLSGKRKDPPEHLGVAGSVFSPQVMAINTRSAAIDAAIEKIPAWQKKTGSEPR